MAKTKLFTLCVNIIAGIFYGYGIGFVPIYTTFNTFNTDCSKLTGVGACENVQHASCVWVPVTANGTTTESCMFNDYKTVSCSNHTDQSSCAATAGCTFDYASKSCGHEPDWSAIKMGIFAGGLIAGGMFGSIFAGKMAESLGRKRSLLLIAVFGLIASALMTGSRVGGFYGMMIAARLLLGIASGCACVVAPMYVEEMAPEHLKGAIGSFYQISITFGICLAAGLGYAIEPRDKSVDMHMELRFQVLIGVQWLSSVLLAILSLVMPESDHWLESRGESTALLNEEQMKPSSPGSPTIDEPFPVRRLLFPLIGATFLAVSLQLTGINAVMNYAPNITKAAGLTPLLGNLIVMIWNFVTTLVSIPLTHHFTPRRIYLAGTLGASVSCLLTGIPVYPGIVEDDTARHILAGVGIILFVGFFEMSMGPVFYLLAQRLFPKRHRPTGASITLMIQFVANVIVNVCFPVSVVALSGGPSENQNKGMSLVFIIFGAIGLLCLAIMFKTLHAFNEEEEDAPYPE